MNQPLYIAIANELRRRINHQTYAIGQKLPTETQLAEYFQVNRHTIRKAVSLLKREGLLRVGQGRGTFVAGNPINYPLIKLNDETKALKNQGRQSSFNLLQAITITANIAVAEILGLSLEEPVALIEYLTLADGQPICVSNSYFSLHRFPDILQHCYKVPSISLLLQQVYECDRNHKTTRISTSKVKPQDARLLELPLTDPILVAKSVNVDHQDTVVEYQITRWRGDLVELVLSY